ncbi:MAG: DUF4292 domain-containing protein [Bacteroidales bacterium]|nr:DUF4292 domain-containing protein [Bacteroidales bacterium]
MKKTLYILLTAVILLTGVSSCKSTRQSSQSQTGLPSASGSGKPDMAAVIGSESASWTTLQVPMTLTTTTPASFKAGAKVYMTRDSSIYISFTVLGMEMAAIQVTNDSIFGVDKMNKRYVAESLNSITANYPVSVSTLQDMFMGQAFIPGVKRLGDKNVKDFKFHSEDNGTWSASPVKQFKPYNLKFIFDPDNKLRCTAVSAPESLFRIEYSELVEMLGIALPQTDELEVDTPKLKLTASMKWNWNKARFNNPSDNKKIKINPSYKRISAPQLLKSIN